MLKITKEQEQMIKDLFAEMQRDIDRKGMQYTEQSMGSGKTIVFSETVGDFRIQALTIAKDMIIQGNWSNTEASAFSQAFGRKTHKLFWNK